MKQLGMLAGCAVILLGLGGCGQQNEKISGQPLTPAGGQELQSKTQEEVLPEVWDGEPPVGEALPDFFPDQTQTSAFPESMVGVWEVVVNEYDGSKWGIKFEPDGSILKIIHLPAGPVKLSEGGVSSEGPEDSYYNFVMGPCEARYIPETGMIKVKIIVDYFIFKFPVGELEGRIEDYFEGPVSEDGKTWNVKWWNFGWVKDAAPPDINLTKANPEPLVFTKLDLTQIKHGDGVQ
jgi:hypothetical protein